MDAPTFRADFPEFADAVTYPTAQVNFWIGVAGKLLNVDRWYDLIDFGTELFTAHWLTLQIRDEQTVAGGGIPGTAQGVQVTKTVDKVSVSYDVSQIALDQGGHWNTTSYGIRFLQLARMAGAGGVQLN